MVRTDVDDQTKVSIVIRTKDRPVMLRRALQSILNQTAPEWEAVIVNDGGDPALVDAVVAERAGDIAGRVSVVHVQSSAGRWPSANAGVRATTAPYIVLHDDDDSWHPDFLRHTVTFLDAHPEEVGVITRTEVILEEFDSDSIIETGRYLLEDHNPDVLLADLMDFNRFVPISFVYRRSLHDVLGLYDESLPAAADWAFNLGVVTLRPIAYTGPGPLAYWHQRPGVSGVEGNSVFAATSEHRSADRRHRDGALRSFVQGHGTGLPLYLAFVLEERGRALDAVERERTEALHAHIESLHDHINKVEGALARLQTHLDRTIDARFRGWAYRQKRRLKRH